MHDYVNYFFRKQNTPNFNFDTLKCDTYLTIMHLTFILFRYKQFEQRRINL